jgi:uncharacterized protein (DUF2267 family)
VDYEQFVTIVQERSGLDRDGAERAIRATLKTLSELLTHDRAEDVRFWLPEQIGQWVTPGLVAPCDVQESSAAWQHGRRWICPRPNDTSGRSSTPSATRWLPWL